MVKTNVELEIEIINERIDNLKVNIELFKDKIEIAKAYEKMKETPEWKLVIQKTFLDDEKKAISEELFNSTELTEEYEKALIQAAGTIRQFGMYCGSLVVDEEVVKSKIKEAELAILKEEEYKSEVASGTIDLGEE